MADINSDEEQLEAIKRWWKENGTSLVVGVAVAAAGIFGWKAWQQYQLNQSEAASQRYQELLSLSRESDLDAKSRERAHLLIDELEEQHDSTLYADLGRFIEVRLAVDNGNISDAMAPLNTIANSSKHPYMQGVARLRLARLQLAQNDADAALATLDTEIPSALAAIQLELRGDTFLALAQHEKAATSWREALTLNADNDQAQYAIRLKLDDLGVEETSS
ncbi:YfgM family protein [Halomonas halocynthiae]|uniref:YfgM family protein n=1 Tax=Halomonas halocynthiae TaxID=176290 RepID=UPI00040DFD8A|nr:tetratricopeptide repeat protein [Halomonas halocynthiae]